MVVDVVCLAESLQFCRLFVHQMGQHVPYLQIGFVFVCHLFDFHEEVHQGGVQTEQRVIIGVHFLQCSQSVDDGLYLLIGEVRLQLWRE